MPGFFAKKELLFEFDLVHYSSQQMLFQTNRTVTDDCGRLTMAFLYYLDKVLYNIGPGLGPALWKAVGAHAASAWQAMRSGQDDGTKAHVHEPSLVPTDCTPSGKGLKANAKLFVRNDVVFIETTFTPMAYPATEGVVMQGCESLLLYLYNHLTGSYRLFLTAAASLQVSWYEQNGHPSLRSLGAAPIYGMTGAFELIEQSGPSES